MLFAEARILIFAKAPEPGTVKTRLIPPLTPPQAALLQQKLTLRIVALATTAALAPVELWCAPAINHPFLQDCHTRFDITLRLQEGQNLGERMARAFTDTLVDCPYAILIGTDTPMLTANYLNQALQNLKEGYDAVIGPAMDGGYVLIGLRRFSAALFADIAWGTDKVLQVTRDRLAGAGFSWHELTPQPDIDRPEDLRWLDPAMLKSWISAD